MNGKFCIEVLTHYSCGYCNQWWTIADEKGDPELTERKCPKCGVSQYFNPADPLPATRSKDGS